MTENTKQIREQTAVLELMNLSHEEMKREIKEKFNHSWFTQFYIYNIDGISSMVYHTLRNKKVMKVLITRTGDDDYFGLGSETGMKLPCYNGVDDFGHSGFSMAQTVFLTQQIIRKGIDSIAEFYKNKKLRHSIVSDETDNASEDDEVAM